MDPIIKDLNPNQLAAVTSPANVVQILAPPGSGKTKTLTARVAYLVKHHSYKPWNVLCLTFTIKSSREMKERLAKLVGNGVQAKLILGTFHSVCRRYLVSYGHLIGISRDFGIADSSDSLSIIKRIVKRMRFNLDPKAAQARISSSKSKGIGYPLFSAQAAKKKNVDQQEFAQVFEAYVDQLDRANVLDYDDLLLRCSDLLRQHPTCVSNVEAVLVDEFQDTNVVQFDLMTLFAAHHKRITTVGDPDQSIYGWRSAEIKNLGRMQTQYPDTLVIELQDNYRSSGAILLAAQEVIEQDSSRPAKALLPTHCPGTSPVLRRLPSSDVEASWIVSEIKRTIAMTGGMLKFPDFAILLRSAALSRQIESAMGKAGIPYRMVGGQRFFDRVEIKILLDYLRVVSQPTNNDAVARILNVPTRGIGPTTVKSLLEEAESRQLTLWSLARDAVQGNIKTTTKINKPAEKGLGVFINIILIAQRKLKDSLDPLSPQALLQHVISKLSFQDYLKRNYEIDHEGRWANVEELLAQAGDYPIPQISPETNTAEPEQNELPFIEGIAQSQGGVGEEILSMFLANVALATELQKDEETEEGQSQSQVTISTIHAAKGLEWPVVFIPAAYEGSIPHSRAEDTDEERRLLYVAMTRAQSLLYISCPVKNSQREESKLSQFLDPKTVGHYVVKSGPKLDSGVVSDIARILKRPFPLEKEIFEQSRTLDSQEDDVWPLDGRVPPEVMVSKWDNSSGKFTSGVHRETVQRSSRLAHGQQPTSDHITANTISKATTIIGNLTTMDDMTNFSVQTLGGFTSATSQLRQLEREPKTERIKSKTAGHRDAQIAPAPMNRKRKVDDEGQSSLPYLWGARPRSNITGQSFGFRHGNRFIPFDVDHDQLNSVSSADSAQHLLPVLDSMPRVSSRPCIGPYEDESVLPRLPLAAMPGNQTMNRQGPSLRPSVPQTSSIERDQPKDRFVFLSSSPPPVKAPPKHSTEAVGNPLEANARRSRTEHSATSANTQPAITVHSTSMAQMQAINTTRKTLGVRRSMGGWNSRAGQGYAVPKKVQR
ncbi:MAG: hypothetical protein LQ345_000418 [Seirophora villosa]|nr:MAG: hypothetical protein LQ345_000418 [Seirophora villosa]